MTLLHLQSPANARRWLVSILAGLLMLIGTTGCDVDSYADPSNVGRWENTPVVLPILDRLDVIEEPEEAIPGLSQPRSGDLIPEVSEYVLGPGDLITVTVFELIAPNVESVQTRRIDELGFIRLPVIGQIKASGLTTKQLEQRIIDILDPDVLRNPTVTVIVQEGRQKTFNVIGAGGGGTFTLLKSDFRLLDALSLARVFPVAQQQRKVYVIRQVPLSDLVEQGFVTEQAKPGAYAPPMRATDQDGNGENGEVDPAALIEELMQGDNGGQTDQPDDSQPDDQSQGQGESMDAASPLAEALEPDQAQQVRWVNVDGRWVAVEAEAMPDAAEPGAAAPGASVEQALGGQLPPPDQLVTQRVIEIDSRRLMEGDATQNIVVRPGDVIRVPIPRSGNIFVGGAIARPGTYSLPGEKTLTLKQLVISAGGLSPVGIPERVDLTRRIDEDTEAIVRLNLRSIFEGVQPDIYLKPDDTINVGTNLPAPFLAVIRNSFRMTYGFGFLLDRNFSDKVFGPIDDN